MPNSHPRPWHRGSLFGDGPRRPLDREQRARFKFLVRAHARAGRLPAKQQWVAESLLKRLGTDGQCDPTHETLATDAGCEVRTVRRGLDTLKALGLVRWVNRLVRDGWRAVQTSNAYLLLTGNPPVIPAVSCDGQRVLGTRKDRDSPVQRPVFEVSPEARQGAQAALAQIAAQRRAAIEARLLGKV